MIKLFLKAINVDVYTKCKGFQVQQSNLIEKKWQMTLGNQTTRPILYEQICECKENCNIIYY